MCPPITNTTANGWCRPQSNVNCRFRFSACVFFWTSLVAQALLTGATIGIWAGSASSRRAIVPVRSIKPPTQEIRADFPPARDAGEPLREMGSDTLCSDTRRRAGSCGRLQDVVSSLRSANARIRRHDYIARRRTVDQSAHNSTRRRTKGGPIDSRGAARTG